MKKITYKKCVEFFLPNHWGVFDIEGKANIYENGDEKNVLQVYFISSDVLASKTYLRPIDMLKDLPEGCEQPVEIGRGISCKFDVDECSRNGKPLISFYWILASSCSLSTKKVVLFSYTVETQDSECKEIVKLLDKQIKSANFIGVDMDDDAKITVTLETGKTLIVGEVQGIYY